MKSSKMLWLCFMGALLAGCASPKTVQQAAATADFGLPPNAEQTVKAYFAKNLFNPASLKIQSISQPYKGYAYDPAYVGKGQNFGWGINTTIVASDHGGYAMPTKQYALFVRNGSVLNAFEIVPPQQPGNWIQPIQ